MVYREYQTNFFTMHERYNGYGSVGDGLTLIAEIFLEDHDANQKLADMIAALGEVRDAKTER
jgi:hypothetical protein